MIGISRVGCLFFESMQDLKTRTHGLRQIQQDDIGLDLFGQMKSDPPIACLLHDEALSGQEVGDYRANPRIVVANQHSAA